MKIGFQVITKIESLEGVLYDDFAVKRNGKWTVGADEIIDKEKFINVRIPAFELGEIVIVDLDTGREIDGAQRKPSKWVLEYEEVETLEEAIKIAQKQRKA